MKRNLLALGLLSFALPASAMSLDWSGTYRAEWLQLNKPNLTDPSETKAYGLHYLSLSPKIIASDGINITGKFDVLGSSDPAYANSQTGMLFGGNSSNMADGLGENKEFTSLRVSQLYLTLDQEYGSLLVGRAPFHFGLGMLYNAGNGPFDHWLTTSDYVAYKFIVGNLSFTPMFGRTHVPQLAAAGVNGVTQDEIIHIQYDNKDAGAVFGVMMAKRKSAPTANDSPAPAAAGTGAPGSYSTTTTGVTFERAWESFQFKMEAEFLKGSTGYSDTTGSGIDVNSYGIAVEMNLPRPQSKWEGSFRFGMASGDNPDTEAQESFFFHRNYDIAMLMFNHRLGQADFLGTSPIKAAKSLKNTLDDETVSNTVYLAPELRYAWTPKLTLKNTLVYAQLMNRVPGVAGDASKDFGFEWDISLDYQARENVRWENRLGLLFPGAAFKNGASDFENPFTYGFQTRAAITF